GDRPSPPMRRSGCGATYPSRPPASGGIECKSFFLLDLRRSAHARELARMQQGPQGVGSASGEQGGLVMPLIRPDPFPPIGPARRLGPDLVAPDFAPIAGHAAWRPGWTHIVSGSFSSSPFSGLLCYDEARGAAAFYETDGFGNLHLLAEHDDWRTTWTHLVAG